MPLFKLLSPKEISGVLTTIGVHPTVTPQLLDQPTIESVLGIFQSLAGFTYELDMQSHKAHIVQLIQHGEIFDDAVDLLFAFSLSRQLALINGVDDFNLKDIWEPNAKRLRAHLSGTINFCRYKESQLVVIQEMKENLRELDGVRLELVDKSNNLDSELVAAQTHHNEELPHLWQAESEVHEAKIVVEKLQKQQQTANRVLEDCEHGLNSKKEKVTEKDHRIEQFRKTVTSLQGQIADSPEGLEQEISELKLMVRQHKARFEEKSSERKSRTQRVQAMRRLNDGLVGYSDDLDKAAKAVAQCANAHCRSHNVKEELGEIQRDLEVRREEEAELEQAVRTVTAEIDHSKEVHEERMHELEERRQQALQQLHEVQARRSEEQKRLHALHTERKALEMEISAEQRQHEAFEQELCAQKDAIREEMTAYIQALDSLLARADTEAVSQGTFVAPGRPMMSPLAFSKHPGTLAAASRGISCSPSPTPSRRGLLAGRSLFLSPGNGVP